VLGIFVLTINSFLTNVPEGQALNFVSKKTNLPCYQLFLAAAGKATKNKLPSDERLLILDFAKAACSTKNPDIIWQISYVESGFKMRIINIEGRQVFTGENAKEYLLKGITNSSNIDIGPLQINWKNNGSKWESNPLNFFDGKFSVNFLSNKILKYFVNSCGIKWINCYHSYDKKRGSSYRVKIDAAGVKLKNILSSFN
jgi:hypothetical protein